MYIVMDISSNNYRSYIDLWRQKIYQGTGVFARMHQPLEAMRALHMAALPNKFQAIRGLHGVQIAELQSAADLRGKGLKTTDDWWRVRTSQQNDV